jgi:DNA-binding MarR family transcriptional regulator
MTPTATTPTPDLTERAARLRLAITRTARRMRPEAGSELGPSSMAALATVERVGPLTPSELAKHERIQRPTATRLLSRLSELGLVERTADPSDGRCSIVTITPDGRALLKRLRKRKNAYLARRMKVLPDDDVVALERAAEILERVLEEDSA